MAYGVSLIEGAVGEAALGCCGLSPGGALAGPEALGRAPSLPSREPSWLSQSQERASWTSARSLPAVFS